MDDSIVVNAMLYYAIGATNNTYTAVAMTDLGGGFFEYTIPAQANGTVVKYWFRAWDNAGHNSVDTVSNALAYIVTDGGINTIPLNCNILHFLEVTQFGQAIRLPELILVESLLRLISICLFNRLFKMEQRLIQESIIRHNLMIV